MPDWRREVHEHLAALHLDAAIEAGVVEEMAQHLEDRDCELQLSGLSPAAIHDILRAELAERKMGLADLPPSASSSSSVPPLGASGGSFFANLRQDVRYGARTLRKQSGFTLVAVITLACGIGANSSIFSIVNALLVHPLPYPRSSDLMTVGWKSSAPNVRNGFMAYWSYPRLQILQRDSQAFASVGGYAQRTVTLTGTDDPERFSVEFVSAGYLPTLGMRAERGRIFSPEEDQTPNSHPVVLISHDLWQRRYGGADSMLGRTIQLNKKPFTIIGVMPPAFHGQSGAIEMWLPTMMAPAFFTPMMITSPMIPWLEVVGRLKPGVTRAQAEARLAGVHRQVVATMAEPGSVMESMRLIPMREYKLDHTIRASALVLFAAVGFVLLIACVNVANLLLTRAVARRREIGVRLALGATRGRIMQQLLTESALLALMGGAGGLLLATGGIRVLAVASRALVGSQFGTSASQLFTFYTIRLDWNVLAFNFVLALLTVGLFGVLPAWQASRADLAQRIKDSTVARGMTLSRRRPALRTALVVIEVAMAMVLLAGAGLMLRSFGALRGVQLGFNGDSVAIASVPLTASDGTYAALLARLEATPGVESAGASSNHPFGGSVNSTSVTIDGATTSAINDAGVHYVGGNYFRTLRVPMLSGRAFTDADRDGAPRVAVVNATTARRLWPGRSAVGQRLHLDVNWPKDVWAEVVGVVGDVKYARVEDEMAPDVYLPYRQDGFVASLVVRSSMTPTAIRNLILREAHALDPNMPISNFAMLNDVTGDAMARTRYTSTLLAAMAALALFLAGGGLYGVVYYAVQQRTNELGIRIALGGRGRDILALVLRQGLTLAMLGIVAGLATSMVLTRVLRGMLFGVTPTDPATFGAITLVLLVAGILACYVPARRAMRIDPLVALRSE